MIVLDLQLKNFRNYALLDLPLQPGVNVFFGKNGQGKTNILEAVYLCTCASSHRTSRDKELILQGEHEYRVRLRFSNANDYEQTIDIHYLEAVSGDPQRTKNQRIVSHNGLRLERIGHLPGLFNAVIFSPEDMRMIKDGPQKRRRFMDLLISQIKPRYFMLLQQFNMVLYQRNALLKKLRDMNYCSSAAGADPFDFTAVELDTWDESFSQVAVEIIEYRYEYTRQLAAFAADYHDRIVGGNERLKVDYETIRQLSFDDDNSRQDNIARLMALLKEKRADDIRRGNTGIGPHRDDLAIQLNDSSLRIYGSQGQQRTAVLSLKMAELRLIEAATGNRPILLLDDVMSELDQGRRESLVESIQDYQVLITCTEAEMVSRQMNELQAALPIAYFEVDEGRVTPLEPSTVV